MSKLRQFIALENIALLGLALATALRRRVRPPAITLILTLVVYYAAGHMMVNARMRYILPVMPYVMVLASDQCAYLAAKLISGLSSQGGVSGNTPSTKKDAVT
jgi:hypothetical protein